MLCWIIPLHWDSKQDQAISTLSLLCFCEMQSLQEAVRLEEPSIPPELTLQEQDLSYFHSSILWDNYRGYKGNTPTLISQAAPWRCSFLAPTSSPTPCQRDGIEEGLLDGVTCRWSHHRNRESGLICTLSCSPGAWREHRSCCRYNHSPLMLPVIQNNLKQYQSIQGRIFGANDFVSCSSHMQSLNQKPYNKPITYTSQNTYRAFSMHVYQMENLISWFCYFDVCQKSSYFAKSTRALCKTFGYDPGCR